MTIRQLGLDAFEVPLTVGIWNVTFWDKCLWGEEKGPPSEDPRRKARHQHKRHGIARLRAAAAAKVPFFEPLGSDCGNAPE